MRRSLGILLVDGQRALWPALQGLLQGLGHQVVGRASQAAQALELNQILKPDLALVDEAAGGIATAGRLMRQRPLPIILILENQARLSPPRDGLPKVHGCLFRPLDQAKLGPALHLAHANFQREQELDRQVEALRAELQLRKLLGRAKGILMEDLGLSEGQALRHLERQGRQLGLKLARVAQGVIAARSLGRAGGDLRPGDRGSRPG